MDQSSFFRSFINDSQTIGAVAESSTHLAEEICKFYPKDNPNPVRILEVGAGTGVFTRQLAKMLRPGDVLEVVELMPDFIKMLVKEFHSNQQIKVFGIDVLTLSNEKPYDFIVSGLPFNSFSPEKVSEILQKYESVSKSGTVISFFEYAALPTLKSLLMPSEDYDLTRTIIKSFVEKYEIEKNTVMINLPPAIVHHLLLCK
jgi:phospholipid N-methyltransferase